MVILPVELHHACLEVDTHAGEDLAKLPEDRLGEHRASIFGRFVFNQALAVQMRTLKDLERAYENFFAQRARFPRFKRKAGRESFRYPDSQQFKIDAMAATALR
jgi:hypothetical protein